MNSNAIRASNGALLSFPTPRTLSMSWFPATTIDAAAGTVTGRTDGYGPLVARHSGKCAGAVGLRSAPEVRVMQDTCRGGNDQKYWLRPVHGGFYQLMADHNSLCLRENADSVTQERCDPGAPAQHWKLTPSGEHLAVTSRAGERCLDVQGASAADFATILTYACNRQPNQQWTRGAPE